MSNYETLIQERAEELQQECHMFVKELMSDPTRNGDMTVQDVTNVWLFRKLAELEQRGHHTDRIELEIP